MPSFDAAELAKWSGGTWDPFRPSTIEGVSTDTRALKEGNLYFALTGDRFDGHAFVEEACRKGAGGAVVACPWAPPVAARKLALLRVTDPASALRDVAAAYRRKLDPHVVAVTGSAGKSTVKEMTAQILSTTLPTACTRGNWNNDIGLPLSLLAMEATTRVGVFETGTNHPGELAVLCRLLSPNWGVVTNVGPVHVEFFGTVESIAEEKATLIRSLPSDGLAVLNRDDPFFNFLRSSAPCRVLTVSMQGNADYVCRRGNPSRGEATIEETSSRERFALKMSLPGDYNIVNAMLAIAVARAMEVPWNQVSRAMENYVSLPLRWQEKTVGGVTVINDAYNANPMSMRAAIQAFRETPVRGRKWLILGGMLELGDQETGEHLALGRHVGPGEWAGLVVVGPLGGLIADGAEEAGFQRKNILRCANNTEAGQIAGENLRPGDGALLKASRGIRLEEVAAAIEKVKAN